MFFHPHATINDALNNPNLKIALILVLLPTIIGAIGSLAFGFIVNWVNFIVMLFSEIVFWLVIGFIFYNRTETGKYTIDTLKLKLPVLGDLVRKSSISRFSQTLSTLLTSPKK